MGLATDERTYPHRPSRQGWKCATPLSSNPRRDPAVPSRRGRLFQSSFEFGRAPRRRDVDAHTQPRLPCQARRNLGRTGPQTPGRAAPLSGSTRPRTAARSAWSRGTMPSHRWRRNRAALAPRNRGIRKSLSRLSLHSPGRRTRPGRRSSLKRARSRAPAGMVGGTRKAKVQGRRAGPQPSAPVEGPSCQRGRQLCADERTLLGIAGRTSFPALQTRAALHGSC